MIRVKTKTYQEFTLCCDMCKKHLGQKSTDVYGLIEHYQAQRWYVAVQTNAQTKDMQVQAMCPECQEKVLGDWLRGNEILNGTFDNTTGELQSLAKYDEEEIPF